MYIWKRRKRRRGSCKQESKLGMDGSRRVEWAQEGGRRRGIEGQPRPPTRHGWFQGGAVPDRVRLCASCAAAGAMGMGTEEEMRRRRRRGLDY